jgi:hypothetical protein
MFGNVRILVAHIGLAGRMGASAIHVQFMDELTEADVRKIWQIHSSWIEFEVAGEDHNLMALCADDIELWPPDAQPLLGRRRFRRRWRLGGREFTPLRLAIVEFEVQTRLPT